MNEEIKEILDYLNPKYDIVDEFGNDYKKVKFKDCKLLLNYITNLQQSNQSMQLEMLRNWNKRAILINKIDTLNNIIGEIERLIINHNCDTGDIYYKYNGKYLKSELKERIMELVELKEEISKYE